MPGVEINIPIKPARAPVIPRGTVNGGEKLPVETHVRALMRRHRIIILVGPSGSGKTMALAHLTAALGDRDIDFHDEPFDLFHAVLSGRPAVLAMCEPPGRGEEYAIIDLAPWGEAERIDYLLAKHPARIRAVMHVLRTCDTGDTLDGSPRLWSQVLDAFAEERLEAGGIESFVEDIFRRILDSFGDGASSLHRSLAVSSFSGRRTLAPLPRALQHETFARIAHVDMLLQTIDAEDESIPFWHRLTDVHLIRAVAKRLEFDAPARERLAARLATLESSNAAAHQQAAIVGVTLALNPTYRPAAWLKHLDRVLAPSAAWSGLHLRSASLVSARLHRARLDEASITRSNFNGADLSAADLSGADASNTNFLRAHLTEATLQRANLKSANLRKASAQMADFNYADLGHAELGDADLRGASFRSADLTNAFLSDTKLQAVDFTGAVLHDAVCFDLDFRETVFADIRGADASFVRCRFDGLVAEGINFMRTKCVGSDFTGSRFSRVTFVGANLQQTGLADIDWPGADLRDADFTHAAFYMGSSRSGLIDSPIACEGSRTGFYTHDDAEPHFRPIEEIRKANLSGADLVGAKVTGTDWYLVDLRGARYTNDQAQWFRKCGAILFDRG